MLLVTAARCMRDLRSVETRRVIYSELLPDGTSRIHDSSQLYSLFDLITAMDEFFSTGTAQKLKGYLWSEGESDPALHTLLARINQFSDDLALCRVQALNEDLSQIAQALQAPPKESKNLTSLFFHLLNDRFRTEFEGLLASPEKQSSCAGKLVRRTQHVSAGADIAVRADAGLCLSSSFCAAHRNRLGISGGTESE